MVSGFLACVFCLGCLGTSIYMYQRHAFRNTHACPWHSGRDSDSPPIIPWHWYYCVISTKWLRGRFCSCPPINPTPLHSSSSSSSSFSFAVALNLPFHKLIDLYFTVVDSSHITSAWSSLLHIQNKYILCCTWFASELRGSEVQIAKLSKCEVNYYYFIATIEWTILTFWHVLANLL